MLPFVTDLDAKNLHVQAPSEVIFLCGGPTTGVSNSHAIQSLRDAFNKIIDFPTRDSRVLIQAEDVTKEALFFSHYADVLAFETDLAEITELILLFCESVGSFAELGAFSMIGEIAKRLMVVVRDLHWKEESFIKLGPLRYLENLYGPDAIFVIDDKETGMSGTDASNIDKLVVKKLLDIPLTKHFKMKREPTTFKSDRPGHLIKLIVGLIQDCGALKIEEISHALSIYALTLSIEKISAYLLCAKSVGWIIERRKGSHNLFFSS